MVHALSLTGVAFRRSHWWSALRRMLVPAIVVVVAICADAASASDLGIAKSFFPGDATACAMLSREYRYPYLVPEKI